MTFTQQQADYLVGIIKKWHEVHFTKYQNAPSQAMIDSAVQTLMFIVKDIITRDPNEVIEI
jgi:hypothetical protein